MYMYINRVFSTAHAHSVTCNLLLTYIRIYVYVRTFIQLVMSRLSSVLRGLRSVGSLSRRLHDSIAHTSPALPQEINSKTIYNDMVQWLCHVTCLDSTVVETSGRGIRPLYMDVQATTPLVYLIILYNIHCSLIICVYVRIREYWMQCYHI